MVNYQLVNYILDKERFGQSSYHINFMHIRQSDSNNLVIQFRQNKKPATGNTGNRKNDMVRVAYTGLEGVPVTDSDKCFSKVQIAVMKDNLAGAGTIDWTKCVSTMRTLG